MRGSRLLPLGSALVIFQILGCSGSSPSYSSGDSETENARISFSSRVTLGKIKPGMGVEGTVNIANRGDKSLELSKFDASCPCISLDPPSVIIDPNQTVAFLVKFDPKKEPGFRGKLGIAVVGLDKDQAEVLRFRVDVEVEKETE